MKPLSRSSAGTLYQQLLRVLRVRIESGDIGVGDRLPSEADLVRDHGVSRTTARRALDELRRQGLVRREPGRGTFLDTPRLWSNLAYLHSFSEEIERWGYRPGARLVAREERAGRSRRGFRSRRGSRYCTCGGCGWRTSFRSSFATRIYRFLGSPSCGTRIMGLSL
ncbi:MAG: GntR family transcriptional regulator [Rubrobacteraceae bacterium]|nr:GntR family transcriptional regulator [Rubrobacteraceae bacterium]MBA3792155.1 GntR family transcriptional regulator [Rubrobacter sp.]